MDLLVVEDDAAIAQHIASGLADLGHGAVAVANGEVALADLEQRRFDAVILDRMLPGMDGIEVLRRIRRDHSETPVLILSALGETEDRIKGIDSGADDYLIKPFSMMELSARLNAIVRRTHRAARPDLFAVGTIEVEVSHHKAMRGGRALNLNKKEFGLLIELLRNHDKAVTRRMLIERVWGYSFEPGTNIVESNMSRLRAKLTQSGDADPIETVRGFGYVLHSEFA